MVHHTFLEKNNDYDQGIQEFIYLYTALSQLASNIILYYIMLARV